MPVQTTNLFQIRNGIEPGYCDNCHKSGILVERFSVFFLDRIVLCTQLCKMCLLESFSQNDKYFYSKKEK